VTSMDSEEILRQEREFVWHPFTQMRDWERDSPLVIAGGEGIKLRDTDGNEYYDANSSLWVTVHGHRRPEIDAAIKDQLHRIAHTTMLGLTHPNAALLAERLVSLAPSGLKRVFYSDSGSTAVEIAIKMAYQYWRHVGQPQRTRYIALAEGYHGDTIGAVSVGGIPLFHGTFKDLLFHVDFAPSPSRYTDASEAAAEIEKRLAAWPGQVAAVIVEPLVQAAGGMLLAPPGYLRRVREICDAANTLLIVDEVATGFGRTGRMFACEHEDVSPDLMTVAKGLTGGYLPLAATLATEAIYEAFLGDYAQMKTFFHGHSYTGNPLACAAALASLDIFANENVIDGLQAKIAQIAGELERVGRRPHVGSVRQCGMMVGIELVGDRSAARSYPSELRMGAKVCALARTLGLITRPLGDVVVFMPILSSTADELHDMLRIIDAAIALETEGD